MSQKLLPISVQRKFKIKKKMHAHPSKFIPINDFTN